MGNSEMKKSKIISSTVIVTLMINLVACGTILYPERKGMRSGRIDPIVAGLDAVGLLFYIVPGVIAFVVDYNNGAIYLPRGHRRFSESGNKMNVVHAQQAIDDQYLEKVLKDELHVDTDLESNRVMTKKIASLESVKEKIILY